MCFSVDFQDAHNAIVDFDTGTSFWAVYDGHGGAEVSAYCSLKLPDYLKKLDSYKGGDFEKALRDAFIGFDLTLLDPNVIEELKLLAKKNPDIGPEDSDAEDEDENIADLYQEARMPLREVLERYKEHTQGTHPALVRLQQSEASSKPLSPYLKARRPENSVGAGPSSSGSNNAGPGPSLGPSSISVDENDATVSSSSSGKCEDPTRDLAENQVCNVPDSSSSNNIATPAKPTINTESVAEVSQSSNTTKKPEPVVSDTDAVTNGDVVCGSSEVVTTKQTINEGVSSSSSGAFENGEVSSNTNNGVEHAATTAVSSNNSITSTAERADEVKIVDSSTDESEDDAFEEGMTLL